MDKSNKYIKKERRVGAHFDLQSGLALFVVMMGLLFYIDAAPGAHTLMTALTVASGIAWYMIHHAYVHWHHAHHQGHIHH